jgi:hypothetical protein
MQQKTSKNIRGDDRVKIIFSLIFSKRITFTLIPGEDLLKLIGGRLTS